jgi:putative phosphoribosyl transferase
MISVMWGRVIFGDRVEAGRLLGRHLKSWLAGGGPGAALTGPVVVLGLPRGGVPVAAAVAEVLDAPLDLLIVRKLGVPSQPELAMGAIGEGGVLVLNDEVLEAVRVGERELAEEETLERVELDRRARRLRGGHPIVPLTGSVALIVDDGIATGSTARAACRVARARGASTVVLATPVAPADWVGRIGADADHCIALETPEDFAAVGQFYDRFDPTTDDEVVAIVRRAAARPVRGTAAGPEPAGRPGSAVDEEVRVAVDGGVLRGRLVVPSGDVPAVAVFAHGSGSSAASPRNRAVAEVLQGVGFGTLLVDLLTADEQHGNEGIGIETLARRVTRLAAWVPTRPGLAGVRVVLVGSSTGGAVALWAAGTGAPVAAVACRGGRPDLASARLGDVRCPVLLVVGADDDAVVELSRRARSALGGPCDLRIVAGASHLFEEPGTLDRAAAIIRDWLVEQLRPRPSHPNP